MPVVAKKGVRHTWMTAMLLALALLAAYWPSFPNGPVWDDTYLIVENPFLKSPDTLAKLWQTDLWSASGKQERSSFYRPLTMTTYWLNAQLVGLKPWAIRAGNLLIHFLNALLLLHLLAGVYPAEHRYLAPLFVGVWALSPLCSEPVIWLSGRFDLLVGLLALTAVWLNRKTGWGHSVAVTAAVGLGLFSKENFLGWVPLLLVDDLVVHRRAPRKLVGKYAGIVLVVAAYLGLRASLGLKSVSILADHDAATLVEAFLFAVNLFLSLLVAPVRLDPFHPYSGLGSGRLLGTGILIVAVTLFLVSRGIRKEAGPGVRMALTGWLWFLAALLPSALTGPTLMMIGDRYAYLPIIGLFIAIWPGVVRLVDRTRSSAPKVAAGVFLAVMLVEGALTALRARDWRDDRTLAEASLRSHPNGFYALYTLGTMAAQKGDLDRASSLLRRSLLANDGSWRTWDAICYVLLQQGRLNDAREACLTSAAINPQNPRVWVNLASVYVEQKQWRQAYVAARRSVVIKPSYVNARYLAAVSAANLGRYAEAMEHLEAGLEVDPTNQRLNGLKAALERATSE